MLRRPPLNPHQPPSREACHSRKKPHRPPSREAPAPTAAASPAAHGREKLRPPTAARSPGRPTAAANPARLRVPPTCCLPEAGTGSLQNPLAARSRRSPPTCCLTDAHAGSPRRPHPPTALNTPADWQELGSLAATAFPPPLASNTPHPSRSDSLPAAVDSCGPALARCKRGYPCCPSPLSRTQLDLVQVQRLPLLRSGYGLMICL